MLNEMHNMVNKNTSIVFTDLQDVIEAFADLDLLTAEDSDIFKKIKLSLTEDGKLPYDFTDQEKNYLTNNPKIVWVDYLIYRYKFKIYPRQKKLSKVPVHLLIELTSACNLKCIMCFQSDQSFRTSKFIGNMDFNAFKDVIDKAFTEGVKAISFASRGEPLLYKYFEDAIKYISGKFLEIKINTNAIYLDDKKIHSILKYCDNLLLVFSVESCNSESYRKIRVGGDFQKVVNNIRRFHEIKNKFYPDAKVTTRVSGVILNKYHDIDELKHFWHNKVDELSFERVELMSDTYNNSFCEIKSHCNYLWENMFIWCDGTCNPCDLDYKSNLKVGNITDCTLSEIWNSDFYNKLRDKHATGQRKKVFPCDRCGVDFSY